MGQDDYLSLCLAALVAACQQAGAGDAPPLRARAASSSELPLHFRCPICGKAAKPEVRPFCSTRCADIDLGRWLTDRYAIPTADDEDEDAVPEGQA